MNLTCETLLFDVYVHESHMGVGLHMGNRDVSALSDEDANCFLFYFYEPLPADFDRESLLN